MKISLVLIICIVLSGHYSFAQQEKLDSLEKILKTTTSDLEKVKTLNILSFEYLFIDTAKASNCVKQLREIERNTKNISVKAEATRAIADQYTDLEDYNNAILYYNKALNLFKTVKGKTGDIGCARTLLNLGSIPHMQGDFNGALTYYTDAEPILEKYGEYKFLINLYHKKCDVYEQIKQKDKALVYALKSIKISEKAGDPENIVRSYYTYVPNSGNSALNIEYLKKAKQIIDDNKLPDWLLFYYYFNYGGELHKQKKYKEALGLYSKADSYAFDQREKISNQLSEVEVYFALKDYQNGGILLNEALKNASQQQLKIQERDAFGLYVILDSIKGDYKSALEHLRKSIKLNEEIFTKENQKRIDFLNAKYDATRREAQIQKLVNEKDIQEARLKQKNTIVYAFGAGIFLLIVIILFIYRNHRQKRIITEQKIRELENEKMLVATHAVLKGETDERTRIARDLHDGLGGLLSGTKLILNNMKGNVILNEDGVNTYNNALDLLDSSIAELRRVAYNMMPENLVRSGLQTALEEFCNSLNLNNSITIQFSFYGTNGRFDSNLEIVAFRIAQELVNNAIKHSKATEINVQFVQDPERISLTIQDNGCGFDINQVNVEKSSGIRNIRSRVASFNGQFHIDSVPNMGTEATIEFKL